MNKPQKQTVYLPVKVEDATGNYIPDDSVLIVKEQGEIDKYWIDLVKPQEGYFFTPEQLNEYTQSVIKQTLNTAADKTEREWCSDGYSTGMWKDVVDKQSITNTFEETYQKLKV